MSKDHFVAQTYLKHFGDATRGGMLHAYRKSNDAPFPCWPKDVCHEWGGDLNLAFLVDRPELLGDFRKIFEPHWNLSVANILSGTVSHNDKFVVSGYMANLMTCAPAWRRVGVESHNRMATGFLSFAKKMKEKHGGQPELPVEAIESLQRSEIGLDTDADYIKAITTRQLLDHAWCTYNQDWAVLANATAQPFVTSDNPVALCWSGNPCEPMTRFLSITPRLCLSVTYKNLSKTRLDINDPSRELTKIPDGMVTHRRVNVTAAKFINRHIVQCAEDLVFSSTESTGIAQLVKKYARYRMTPEYVEFPGNEDNSMYDGVIIRVREVSHQN